MYIFEKLKSQFFCDNEIRLKSILLHPVKQRRKISLFIPDTGCKHSIIPFGDLVKMFRTDAGIILIRQFYIFPPLQQPVLGGAVSIQKISVGTAYKVLITHLLPEHILQIGMVRGVFSDPVSDNDALAFPVFQPNRAVL